MKIKKLLRVATLTLCICLMGATFAGCTLPGWLPSWFTNIFHEHAYTVSSVVDATCIHDGRTTYMCKCGHAYIEEIPATGVHAWDNGRITTESTCTQRGVKTFTCTVCADTYTESVPTVDKHKWETVTMSPTCEEQGYDAKTCLECGKIVKENYTPALGHNWEIGVPTIIPDTTICEFGYMTVDVCQACQLVESHFQPAVGHEISGEWEIETVPTVSAKGKLTGICVGCGAERTVELPKLSKTSYAYSSETLVTVCNEREGFDYYSLWIDAKGKTAKKAADGLQELKFEVPFGPVAHTLKGKAMNQASYDADEWAGYITEINGYTATCTQSGRGIYVCEIAGCGETVEVVTTRKHPCDLALEKDGDNKIILIETCQECDYVARTDVTSKTKTDMSAATCRGNWILVYNYTHTNGVACKLEVTQAPYYHILNGKYMKDNSYPVGTKGISTLVGQDPVDCQTPGAGVYQCNDCQEMMEVVLTKGHSWVETVIKAPTCTTAGTNRNICSVCNASGTSKTIPALGHTMVVSLELVPTEQEKGRVKIYCTTCNYVHKVNNKELLDIPVLGNKAYTVVVKEGTVDDCENAATYVYTLDINKQFNLKDATNLKWPALSITFEVVVDDVQHECEDKIYVWEETIAGIKYKCTGRYCINCKIMLVTSMERI